MKGIILAGGSGTRLYPLTKVIAKQLLPVYNKPMIYYSIAILMLAEIRDILIITAPESQSLVKKLLGDGSQFGINLLYQTQLKPNGIGEGFIIAEKFIGDDNVCLVLGDNIFCGDEMIAQVTSAKNLKDGAIIFGCFVTEHENYGVIEFKDNGQINKIIEKSKQFISNYAVTGLYFYDNTVIDKAKKLKPSSRGELEITDINNMYLDEKNLEVCLLPKTITWFDAGTYDSLIEASCFIQNIEKTQKIKIACLEEIALKKKWIKKFI